MPNMISSYCELSKEEYLLFLTERAKLIASTKISFGKILESKFIFFLFLKLILGDVRYFYVIKLIIHKMLLILYFRLSFATRHSG
jgi:hypothetical protein